MYFRESLYIYIYIHIVGNFAWRSLSFREERVGYLLARQPFTFSFVDAMRSVVFSNEFKGNFVEFIIGLSMEISMFPWLKGFEIFPYVRSEG